MDKAIVPRIGAVDDDYKLPLWASSVGLRVEVVERLVAAYRDLHSVLTEAQEREIQNPELVRHLREEAEHKADRAEDLLGELEYYRIQGEVEQDEHHDDDDDDSKLVHDIGDGNPLLSKPATDIQLFHKTDREVSNTCQLPHPEAAEEDISRAIEEQVAECHRITSNVREALKLEEVDEKCLQIYRSTSSWTDPRQMSPFPTEHKVHGRDQDRKCIISKLTSEESAARNLSVLAIVGNGGVGKTTLAKVVYNDPAVRKHFDKALWLHVSVYFNEAKITRELLELLRRDRHEDISDMKELQNILGYEIKSKRVLLVLDDMWEDNRKENWDVLLTPLRTNDAKGNMVIITTRKSSVARMTGARYNINLHGLKDEEFWPLFKECAFGDENHKGHGKLQEIGRKIADKLKGYPLAAKSVGKLLSRKLDDGHWTRILDNSEWKEQKGHDDVIPALKISYNYLPRHLQKCFSYCSIFPKNQRYHVQWLVNIWIAQGFIPLADQHTQAEETGRRYLADLIDWGFFLSEPPRPSLLMHDLVHDLAQIVSSHESFTVEELTPHVGDFNLIRHVTVITESAYYGQFNGTVLLNNEYFMQEFAKTFCALPKKDLRTLMLFGAHDSSFASTFHQELGNEIRAVRVLNMEVVYHDLNMLIPNISAFINLRYLWLRSFYRGLNLQLPEAICKLYQLQVLDIKDFNSETVVPKGLHKLRNLRHFFAREQLHAQIANVGDLVFLQELMAFHVRKEHEFSIAQLEKLNEIRGSVSIYNLENIESKEDASKARLSDKQYLTSLRLSWDGMPTSLRKLKIIDGLEPPMCLEKLHIEGYNGSAPSWLGSTAVSLTSLKSLHLEKCQFWSTLPSVDELPLLRELHLINMRRLDKIPLGRGLKVLELSNIPSLKRFVEMESDQPYENLEVIELKDCNYLEKLPFQLCSSGTRTEHLFPKLRRVQIRDCIKTKLPPFPIADTTTDIDVWNACLDYMSFQLSPAANDESRLCLELEGHRVGKMEILDETILRFSKLKDLQELEIRMFPEVRYLPWEGLQQMTALKKFKIVDCLKLFSSSPKLVLPVSVEEMEFDRCDITGKQLSNLMSSLPFLKMVKVQYCKGIKCLSVGMFVDAHSTMEEGLWDIPPSSLVTLEKLDISLSDIQFCSKNGLGELGSLKDIVIWKCPLLLSSMVSEAASMVPGPSLLPPSLLKFDITDMVDALLARSKLASLAELCIGTSRLLISLNVCSCTALQKLKIEECDQLQSIEGLQSLTLLAKLEISSCSKLTSVQLNLCTSLEKLNIDGCDALRTLEGSGSLISLKEVLISTNPVLSYVELHSCWALENLCIRKCPALATWQGFRSLTGIKSLQVSESPGFVSAWKSAAEEMMSEGHYSFWMPLECLDIDDIDVLSMPICRQITSLESLKIRGVLYTTAGSDKVDSLLEHHEQALQLLTSLKELTLWQFEHLESLPSKIHGLQLLQRLTISECPCLESLPSKIHALPSLQRLTINECPSLTSLPEEGLPRSLMEMDLIRGTVELDALCRSIWKDAHFRLYINKVEHLGAPAPHSVEAQLE
ncbi:putative disease resistance protein At3g14460 [Panicum virgatum]|uniref:NB-ARC domain-containing protein n=1 Tax=Panicum virgatum TaxID=38727 RepID=A0A8T0PS89_PANVG|nr:putative disease resistance protein At3g14460 [Panicum virgatum]KAG2563808.1 hypothetical protein PVAP13_8KG363500 [Panicum virgatum]